MPYIGRQTTQGEFIKLDNIQSEFDGSQTTFDLKATGQAYSPGAANALLVSLAGVIQESGIAYTVDDSQITFTTAPTSDVEVFILAMGSRINVGTPSAGTINGSTLVDGSVGANKIAGSSINAAKLSPSFGTYGGTISATAFAGDGSALTGIANTGDVNAGTLNVAGVTTVGSNVIVGSGITLSPDGDGFFTGVVTATSYAGDGSALTGIAATANVRTGILDVAGIATFRDNIIATTASFSSDVSIAGTVSIGGTLTYEDVTNVDSVGLITARNGIVVGSGITLSPDGDIFAVGIVTDSIGNVRRIVRNYQTSSYTLVASDAGKSVVTNANVTIPASVFSIGDAITIVNWSGSDITITCSAVTTYLANDTNTKSSLTLKGRGMATFLFAGGTTVYGAGAGLE